MKKIESYLQIDNKFLGTLLHFKDKVGRGCLKLSFKNKIAGFVKGTDIPTNKPVPVKLDVPINLDLSYKFADSLLEVKKIVNGKMEREFYNVPLPIATCLFMIKIKDWHTLDDAKSSTNPLILPTPKSNTVVITFSFLGTNGQPIIHGYDCLMGCIDLPENPLNKFCIGVAEDPHNNETEDFAIYVPIPKS